MDTEFTDIKRLSEDLKELVDEGKVSQENFDHFEKRLENDKIGISIPSFEQMNVQIEKFFKIVAIEKSFDVYSEYVPTHVLMRK